MKEAPLPEIPLEDDFNDIIAKAQVGLGFGNRELCQKAGISEKELADIKNGVFNETSVRKVANILGLGANALVTIGRGVWYPQLPNPVTGLAMLNTPYQSMSVNSFLVWSIASRDAFIFDTGGTAKPILSIVRRENLTIRGIFLTHSHPDHIADLDNLRKATGAPVHIHKLEELPGTETFSEGDKFSAADITVTTLLTSGHAKGGTTFLISGLERPVAITGDSIFAGSIGGGIISYSDALKNNREKIFTLPDHTLLCPGHGPATTLIQEKNHNPFFPEFQQ